MRSDSSKIADWFATAPILLVGKDGGVHRRVTVDIRSFRAEVENLRDTAAGTDDEKSLLPVTSANADKLPDMIALEKNEVKNMQKIHSRRKQ